MDNHEEPVWKSDDETDKPGPEPDRLKLPYEDWREAVREALEKKKPPEGWPPEDNDLDEDED